MKFIYGLITAMVLGLLFGCSTYQVDYTEQDGAITISVKESVPPFGKKLSEGKVTVTVNNDEEGGWVIDVGANADTDATQTGDMTMKLMDKMIDAGIAIGAASGT